MNWIILTLTLLALLVVTATVIAFLAYTKKNTSTILVPTPTTVVSYNTPIPVTENDTMYSERAIVLSHDDIDSDPLTETFVEVNYSDSTLLKFIAYTEDLRESIAVTPPNNASTSGKFTIRFSSNIPSSAISTGIVFSTTHKLADVQLVNDKLTIFQEGDSTLATPTNHNIYTYSIFDPRPYMNATPFEIAHSGNPFVQTTHSGKIVSTSTGVPVLISGDWTNKNLVIYVGTGPNTMVSYSTFLFTSAQSNTFFGEASFTGVAPMVASTQWLLDGDEVLMVGIQGPSDILRYVYTNSDFSNLAFVGGNASISNNDNNIGYETQKCKFTTSPDQKIGIFAKMVATNIDIYYVTDMVTGANSQFLIPGPQTAVGIVGLHLWNQQLVMITNHPDDGSFSYISDGTQDLNTTPPTNAWTKNTVFTGDFYSKASIIHKNQIWVVYTGPFGFGDTNLFLAIGTPTSLSPDVMTGITWVNGILLNNRTSPADKPTVGGFRFHMVEMLDGVVLVWTFSEGTVPMLYMKDTTGNSDIVIVALPV
jgi:hypothetical protein